MSCPLTPAEQCRALQEAEERRRQFLTMLRESEAEAERDGSVAIEDVLSDIDKIAVPHRR
jgi:antitoxin ParD1/3/4